MKTTLLFIVQYRPQFGSFRQWPYSLSNRFIKKCVTFLYAEFGWASAAMYDRLVMQSWNDLDVASLSHSTALAKGDYERACEPYSLHRATQGQQRRRRGTDSKLAAGKYCSYCARYCNHTINECNKHIAAEAAAQTGAGASGTG